MARSFWELFLKFRVGAWWQAHGSTTDRWPKSCCLVGPKGSGQACFQPRLLPQSGALSPALIFPSCCISSQASVVCSDRRVPFLKALSTRATALLSQAQGMPRQRGFRSMWVYYTVLWRLAPESSRQHPTDPTLISQRLLCFPSGDAPAKRLSLYAGFSHLLRVLG